MTDIAVDSSVIAKWFVPEPDSAVAQKVLTDTKAGGGAVIVLDLLHVEVANVIWKRHRQKKITSDEAKGALNDLLNAPLSPSPAINVLSQALEIAVKHDRTVYDAAFVALSQDMGIKGVTADERLYNAVHAYFPQIVLLRDWP